MWYDIFYILFLPQAKAYLVLSLLQMNPLKMRSIIWDPKSMGLERQLKDAVEIR